MSAPNSPLPFYLAAVNAVLDGASIEGACEAAPEGARWRLADLLRAWMPQVYFYAHPILRMEDIVDRRNALSDVPAWRRAHVSRFVASHWKDRIAYLKGIDDASKK